MPTYSETLQVIGFATGLAGTIGVAVADNRGGTSRIARTTAGITESTDDDGNVMYEYTATLNDAWDELLTVSWDDGTDTVESVIRNSEEDPTPIGGDWTGEAGSGGILITPLLAGTNNPRFSTRKLAQVAKGSGPTDVLTLVDGAGVAIDLSDRDLRLVVCEMLDEGDPDDEFDDSVGGLYKYETGQGSGEGLEVGGDDNNQVSIYHDAANTTDAGRFPYFLWDVTGGEDPQLLMKGILPVVPAVLDV